MSETLPVRVKELLDERVFKFALAAQEHYKTSDLVIFLDLTEPDAELEAILRQRLANSTEIPQRIRKKLSAPAFDARRVLSSPAQSFWFLINHESGEADCVAVNSAMLAPGGTA